MEFVIIILYHKTEEKNIKLSKRKKDFLTSCGFEQTYESEPKMSMGVLVNMEVWEKWEELSRYQLYIHFDEEDSPYCNLYYGSSDDADVFSVRNIISEMKKRGFKEEIQNEN